MAIQTFGVTAPDIAAHHFPQLQSGFTTTSKPTTATVGQMISDAAARLATKLRAKGIDPATLNANASTNPEAVQLCIRAVRLGTAIEAMGAMTAKDPDVAKAWQKDLDAFFTDLEERGFAALGDAPAPASPGLGPASHISAHSLETADPDLMSNVEPPFRMNDLP